MSVEWVRVPVPEHLVADVIRFVSDHLDEEGVDAADTDLPDSPEDGWVWWQNLERSEQRLIAALATRGGDEVESWTLAEDLDVSTRELGGIVGPLNKRMRQEKLRPPVRSRQASVSGRRVKRLSVDPGYLAFVGDVRGPRKVATRGPVGRTRGAPSV